MCKATWNKKGNIKVGNIWTWSTLAGNDDHYIPEMDRTVTGTCGAHCAGCKGKCYVFKSYNRYTSRDTGKCSVKLGHARNTIAMREDIEKCFSDLCGQIDRARKNKLEIGRFDQSGEIENAAQFGMMCRIAARYPDKPFYVYSKNDNVVVPMLLAGVVPENLTVLISVWHEYGIAAYNAVKHLPNVKAFVYVDGFDYAAAGLDITTMCGAYNERGKLDHDITCDKCRKCFSRAAGHKVVGCYDH